MSVPFLLLFHLASQPQFILLDQEFRITHSCCFSQSKNLSEVMLINLFDLLNYFFQFVASIFFLYYYYLVAYVINFQLDTTSCYQSVYPKIIRSSYYSFIYLILLISLPLDDFLASFILSFYYSLSYFSEIAFCCPMMQSSLHLGIFHVRLVCLETIRFINNRCNVIIL